MQKILIAYTTNAGSTQEIADAIAEEIRLSGREADVRRVEECTDVSGYSGAIIGAPMIVGWSRPARAFVHRHRAGLARIPVAYFSTLMSLTQTHDVPEQVRVDPWLPKPPKNPARLGIKENYATLRNYLKPIYSSAPEIRPVSVAFFGGKMEMFRLKWWQMLFVMLIIQAQPGDLRDWDFIRAWAREFAACLPPVD